MDVKKVYFPLGAEHLGHFIDDEHVDNFTWRIIKFDNQDEWTLKKVYFPLGAEHFAHLIDDEHFDNFTWRIKAWLVDYTESLSLTVRTNGR